MKKWSKLARLTLVDPILVGKTITWLWLTSLEGMSGCSVKDVGASVPSRSPGGRAESWVCRVWTEAEEPVLALAPRFSLSSLGESHVGGEYNYPCTCHFGKRTCARNPWKEISRRGKSTMCWLAHWGLAAAAKTLCEGVAWLECWFLAAIGKTTGFCA